MSRAGSPEPVADLAEPQRRRAAGTLTGSLIFALFLLFFILFDAQAVYQHRWASFTGITVFILALVTISTGGVKWLRRALRGGKQPTSS